MILANGVLWMFWITVCVPKAIMLGEKIAFGQYLFLGLVEIGWLISTLAVALIFSLFRKLLSNQKTISFLFKIFSLAFIYFALSMIHQSIRYFIK
jgi:threonine/homoserine/homoserine lactone efflux protein